MLQFGMPPGFAEALATKYGIMQLQAQAQAKALNEAANLDATKADLLPRQTAADIAESGARTALTGEQAKFFGPTALANIGLTNAQTGLTQANTSNVKEDTTSKKQLNRKLPFGLSDGGYGFGGFGYGFSQ